MSALAERVRRPLHGRPRAQAELGYTRTLALVRMPDPTTRAKLALTATAQNWSMAELRQTVDADKATKLQRAPLKKAVTEAMAALQKVADRLVD